MKTITAFVQDPLVIRDMNDDKIHAIARKLKGYMANRSPANRSPRASSSYNKYVKDQMAMLASDEETQSLTPNEKFRKIGKRWTTHDNPHKCIGHLKRAVKEKLCPQCPTDLSDDGWNHLRWIRADGRANTPQLSPVTPFSPKAHASPDATRPPPSTPVSPKASPAKPSPPSAPIYLADSASTSASTSVTARKKCPSSSKFFCKTGPQRGHCVSDVVDCAKSTEVLRLEDRRRQKCVDNGTGDVCDS